MLVLRISPSHTNLQSVVPILGEPLRGNGGQAQGTVPTAFEVVRLAWRFH